jgi:hypothetical protein
MNWGSDTCFVMKKGEIFPCKIVYYFIVIIVLLSFNHCKEMNNMNYSHREQIVCEPCAIAGLLLPRTAIDLILRRGRTCSEHRMNSIECHGVLLNV